MFAILIMLIVLIEVILAGAMVFYLIKTNKTIQNTNKDVILVKKGIIKVLSDYRISVKMLNQQVKIVKSDQQIKQILDTFNFLGTLALIFGLKKKNVCK